MWAVAGPQRHPHPRPSFWRSDFKGKPGCGRLSQGFRKFSFKKAPPPSGGGAFHEESNAALIAQIEADNLVLNLQGAAVKIFGVGRGGGEERTLLSVPRLNKLLDFWNTLFERSGAAPVTISQNLVAD